MGAPRDIDLGGILVAPFVRYLFLALVILCRSVCCRSPRIEINVRESSTGRGGPVRLHPRFPCGALALSQPAFRTALVANGPRLAPSCRHPIENIQYLFCWSVCP
jgi:hypothetical protein